MRQTRRLKQPSANADTESDTRDARNQSNLRLLTARRTDLICDRVRSINRLRATLLEYFPTLERAFDYSQKAPLILLGGYQTPEGIRRIGLTRLTGRLRKRGCRNSAPWQ